MRQTDFNIVNQVLLSPENALVLVGTALDGPSQIPFSIPSSASPYDLLGACPLADAYTAAKRAGVGTIVMYRLNGVHSIAQVKDRDGKVIIELRSVSASDKYNQIQVILYPTHLHVINTDGVARSYFFEQYPRVTDLVYAINRDSFYGLIEFTADALEPYFSLENSVDAPTEVLFKGGEAEAHLIHSRDPLSESPTIDVAITPVLKERLQQALFGENSDDINERVPNSSLGVLHFGVIALCDMYHDDVETDEEGGERNAGFTEILGSFCMNKTKEIGFGCVGVIGTKPIYPEDFVELSDTVHARAIELASLSESMEDLEAYKYVQVIVGHTEYPESDETSIPLAYGYAATQALLPYYTMMTNKSILGAGKLNFALNKEDIALLTANGYTCIVPSIRRGLVPYYASSFSKDKNSLASKPHNLRISQHVSRILVEEVDGFIGENYTKLSIKEVIEKAKGILDGLVVDRVIKSYNISYELLENNTVLNINTSLTPFSEIKSISSIATISFPQGGVE